jgi:hypothetical protein
MQCPQSANPSSTAQRADLRLDPSRALALPMQPVGRSIRVKQVADRLAVYGRQATDFEESTAFRAHAFDKDNSDLPKGEGIPGPAVHRFDLRSLRVCVRS